jgi:hypothetical protein
MSLLSRFRKWYIHWRLFRTLSLVAPALMLVGATVPVSDVTKHFGANIPVPYSWRFGLPILSPVSENMIYVHRDIIPTLLRCVGYGAAAATSTTFTLHECDANATNCTDLDGDAPVGATNLVAVSDTSFTDNTVGDNGLLRVQRGQWLRLFVSAYTAGPGPTTQVSCTIDYNYYH